MTKNPDVAVPKALRAQRPTQVCRTAWRHFRMGSVK